LTGRDRLGLSQAIRGFVLGLIALFRPMTTSTSPAEASQSSSKWGIPCIAASVVVVLTVSQLATRARDREAYKRDRERDLAREAKGHLEK